MITPVSMPAAESAGDICQEARPQATATASMAVNSAEADIARLQPVMTSSRGGYRIYTFRAAEAPALMLEVGRLREQAFRSSGGGTNAEVDIDADDTSPEGYRQVVAWDAVRKRVAGGYRYIFCGECDRRNISTAHYFRFSDRFRTEYLPHAVEMGRSFVVNAGSHNPAESAHAAATLFVMESLWQGLGRIVAARADVRYLFGKVTVYRRYDPLARELLMTFLHKFFPSDEPLIEAAVPVRIERCESVFAGATYAENYLHLTELLRRRGECIPPMIHAYMKLCPTMQVFDTMINHDFGDAFETAILLPVDGMTTDKKNRYMKKTSAED